MKFKILMFLFLFSQIIAQQPRGERGGGGGERGGGERGGGGGGGPRQGMHQAQPHMQKDEGPMMRNEGLPMRQEEQGQQKEERGFGPQGHAPEMRGFPQAQDRGANPQARDERGVNPQTRDEHVANPQQKVFNPQDRGVGPDHVINPQGRGVGARQSENKASLEQLKNVQGQYSSWELFRHPRGVDASQASRGVKPLEAKNLNKAKVPDSVNQFLSKSKGVKPPEQKLTGQSQTQIAQKNQTAQNRSAVALRQHVVATYPGYRTWFNSGFFGRHNYHPRYNWNGYWGGGPNWYGAVGWLGWAWSYPIYYDNYGTPTEVNQNYYSQQNYYNQQSYYQQNVYNPQLPETPNEPENLPNQQPIQSPIQPVVPQSLVPSDEVQHPDDWMPLGIFAAGKTENDAVYSNMFVQLALNKDGTIAGTYYNAATDKTYPIAGRVDKESQLAAWSFTDDPESPVVTTGLYNLLQDVAPIQVHFPDGIQQSWTYVRLKDNQGVQQ